MKKTFEVIKTLFVWAIVLVAICMCIFTIVSSVMFGRNDRQLFGYRMYIVNSDSMAATDFNAGDLIFVKETDPSILKEGDVIAFLSQSTESFGETITHKIRRLTTDAEGNPGFITYGTTTDTDDVTIVTYPYVLGRYAGRIPRIGVFFSFLKTTPGYFVCIFLPFLLIIVYETTRFFRLLHGYRAEQTEQLQEEKSKLLAELQALKKEMDVHKAILTGERFATKKPTDKDFPGEEFFDEDFYVNNSLERDGDFEWKV